MGESESGFSFALSSQPFENNTDKLINEDFKAYYILELFIVSFVATQRQHKGSIHK